VWLGAGLLAWAALSSMVATAEGLAEQDRPVLGWLTSHRSPSVTQLMEFVSSSAVAVLTAAAVIAATLTLGVVRHTWRPLGTVLLAFGAASIISQPRKNLVQRARLSTAVMLGTPASGWSFPSGHTPLTSAPVGVLVLLGWRRSGGRLARVVGGAAGMSAARPRG
jgi:undecaprenyl-diphosphatase